MLQHIFKQYGLASMKCDPLSAGAALGISAGLNALGGMFGLFGQDSANETNLQIARETNEMQYKMFHEQQDFNERMWNESNAYNDPSRQMERLRAAGINPFAILGSNGQGSLGQAGITTSPSAPALQAAHVEALNPSLMIQGLTRSVGDYFDNINKDAEAQSKQIDLLYKHQEWEAKLTNMIEDRNLKIKQGHLSQAQRDKLITENEHDQEQLDIMRQVRPELIKGYQLNNEALEAQAGYNKQMSDKIKYENQYQQMVNEAFPELNALQSKVLVSQIASNMATANAQNEFANLSKKDQEYRAKQIIEQTIINGIRSNEFKASQFGLNEKEAESLRKGEIVRMYKNHPLKRKIDAAIQHTGEMLGSPLRLLKIP